MSSNNEQALRDHLRDCLDSDHAHLKFEDAVKAIHPAARGKRPEGTPHSPWELLEHLRIAQWDILEFTRDAKHVSPEFPSGYWPSSQTPPSDQAWDESVQRFLSDQRAFADLIADTKTDLYAPIPHGTGQTPLREALVVIDHNAYHLGQLVTAGKLLK